MEKNATPPPAKSPQSDPHTVRRKQRQFRFRRRPRQPLSARTRALRWRRVGVVVLFLMGVAAWLIANPASWQTEIIYGGHAPTTSADGSSAQNSAGSSSGSDTGNSSGASGYSPGSSPTDSTGAYYAGYILAKLPIQAPADGSTYEREEQFYSSWPSIEGCSLRQRIIKRDFTTATLNEDNCTVIAGLYTDPYSGEELEFHERSEISRGVQIDHVVALSNAWQTGAQNLSADARYALATDPLNLVAAGSAANQDKSDGDASEWLPPNRAFRCEYVARQIAVKYKYHLWVTEPEHAAMITVLTDCPAQTVTGISPENVGASIEPEKVGVSALSVFANINTRELPHAKH